MNLRARLGVSLAACAWGIGAIAASGCGGPAEPAALPPASSAPSSGPPFIPPPPGSPPRPPPEDDPETRAPQGPPVVATFIDLSAAGAKLRARTCEQIVVTVARGSATAATAGDGETLGVGDFLVTSGEGALEVRGHGLALVAAVRTEPCTPRRADAAAPPLTHRVHRASASPALTWAKGKMEAHLDVEKDLGGAYVGRLAGTAAVAEHAHEGSWEILGAIDGQGTFTLDATPKRLGPREIVAVPPGTKHAWTPDPGTRLVAVQFYWPAGPEQRFRELHKKER